ncbi:MAG: hypothetical protein JWN24_1803 [Phycisphaerales bacterium]|nr:hypothetical protein [Phycisphaerales bacterium]
MPLALATGCTLAAVPSAWTSTLVLLTLFTILGASAATFWLLIDRWTARRHWTALADWGREQGFRFRQCKEGQAPAPFDAVRPPAPQVQVCMADGQTTILHLKGPTPSPVESADPPPHPPIATPAGDCEWHVLVREIETAWPPTGLRPAAARNSVLDLFSLTSFPLLGSTERFIIYATDSIAATALSRSAARGLLPPDIGLLLHGKNLVLDFSSRPFDSIEFERMIVLANQLVNHMPAPAV